MGQINRLSLRKSLIAYIAAFLGLAAILSAVTFAVCGNAAESILAPYPPSGEKYYLTNEQGEQLGEGAYIGKDPVPMTEQDERMIEVLEAFPVAAAPVYTAICIIAAAWVSSRNAAGILS